MQLKKYGYVIAGVHASGESALQAFTREAPDLVLMDIRLKGEMDGILEFADISRPGMGKESSHGTGRNL